MCGNALARLFTLTKNRDSIAPGRMSIAYPDWLADAVRQLGLEPTREEFSLSRVDPVAHLLR